MRNAIPSFLLGLLLAGKLLAAPFAEWFQVDTPSGGARIWGEGDEFSAVFESEDGRTLVFSRARRAYVYADKDWKTGALKETDVELGREKGREAELAKIARHLRNTSAAARDERKRRIEADEEACGTRRRWRELKSRAHRRRAAAKAGAAMAPPSESSIGTVTGLTLLIDFPVAGSSSTLRQQEHPSVTKKQLEELLNGENCTLYGNSSSLRSYYKEVSRGQLDYSNVVLGWFLAKHPREYYDNPTLDNGPSARELIGEVLQQIAEAANYEASFLPVLKQLSRSGSSFKALNVWFAGPEAPVWSMGLWAHKGSLGPDIYNKLSVDIDGESVHFREYQVSPITSSPSIGTFCHENGHMVCDFPDLYSYEDGHARGLGKFCLMSYSGGKTPVNVCAYLRAAAGWVTPKELTPGVHSVSASIDDVWRWSNPEDEDQYYLIENRHRSGRDSAIPGSGVMIVRCDESGDNTKGTYLPGYGGLASCRMYNEASLEQADGQYHLEHMTNGKMYGEPEDLWYSGNPAAGYGGVFSDDTLPCALWRDGTRSWLHLSGFSAAGKVMSFIVQNGQDAARPANDDFLSATAISGNSGMASGTNVGATSQVGEPLLASYSGATRTVWWKWTAPTSGSVTINTAGSSFDTQMGIYTGLSLSSLSLVARNDNSGSDKTSACTFGCTGGTTYYVCVGGCEGSVGAVKLHWDLRESMPAPDLAIVAKDSTWPAAVFLSKSGETSGCSSFVAGSSVDFSFRVCNIGSVSTPRTFGTRVSILRQDGTVKYTYVYTNSAVVAAGAGAFTYNHATWGAFPLLPAGSYVFKVEVDCHEEIAEANEDNNVASVRFSVTGPTTYEIRFEDGGGLLPMKTGSLVVIHSLMASLVCEVGEVYALPECTFTPPVGKRFAGWACSNGRRYDDGMLVFNLAQPGETVTMTAIWE